MEMELGLRDLAAGVEGPPCLPCFPGRLWDSGGTPQSCPRVVTAIPPLQSFFEGWDASKKKDKTKGRQDHVSTCESLQQRLRHPEQLEKPSKGLWGLFLVDVWSVARNKLVGFGWSRAAERSLFSAGFPA